MYRYKINQKQEKLAQYGRRVLGLTGDDLFVASEAIDHIEAFFHSLGIGTKITDYNIDQPKEFPSKICDAMEAQRSIILGEHKDIKRNDVFNVLNMAI